MKRFFRNLKSLAMVAVVGFATLTVSCYDDTELRDSIAANTEDIADLTARVEALEIKLGNEVNALKALIADEIAKVNDAIEAVEDKIVIASAEKNTNGEWILTLADGETVTVYPQYQENNNGLLTTVKENGVYYWAQIVDGVATKLVDENGNGYAVHHATVVPEIPEGHDAPQVRVNEQGFNEVSFDGGKNWIQLGGGGDAGLFQSVTTTENTITFVLNDGKEFTVTLPEPFNFEVDGNKVFLSAEQAIDVKMKVSGIKDLTVIAKPEGWKVAINGNKLNVVAPAQAAIEAGEVEKTGAVKVLGITNDNQAIIGKLFVSVDKGVYISFGEREVYVGMDENYDPVYEVTNAVIFDNQMTYLAEDWYTGEMVEQPQPLMVGIFPKGEFTMEQLAAELAQGWYGNYPYESQNVYENGETAFAFNKFFADSWSGEVIPYEPGASYIIFAAPYVSKGMGAEINPDEIVTYEYVNTALIVEEVSSSAFDIQISVNISGFEGYRYYLIEAQYSWEEEWNMAAEWNEPFGQEGTYEKFEGSLFDFGSTGSSYSDIVAQPGTLYNLVIAPIVDGECLKENVKVFTFKTANAVAGGSVNPVFTEGNTDYSNIRVDVAAVGAKMTYYSWFNEENYAKYEGDDELLFETVTENGYVKVDENFSITNNGLSQGDSRWLVAYSIDKDGKYGSLVKQKFTTKVFTFSDTMTISIDEFKLSDMGTEAWVKVSVTGNTSEIVQYRYANISNEFSWNNTYGGTFEKAAQYVATVPNAYYGPKFVDPTKDLDENGYIHIQNLAIGETYNFVIIAFDADGNVTPGAGTTYTPEMNATLIYAEDEGWAESAPTVVVGEKDIYQMYGMDYADYTYTITPTAGTARYWYRYMSNEYEATYNTPWTLMQYMVTNVGTSEWYSQVVEGDAPITVEVWEQWVSADYYIYVTWQDADGNFYECVKTPVFTAEEIGTPEEGGAEGGEPGIMI